MFFKKYPLENLIIDGIEYQSIKHTMFRESFNRWKSKLSKEEIKALKKYRRSNSFLLNRANINAKIRNGEECKEAEYLSNSINKFDLSENIIAYRTIAKKEKEFIQQFSIGEIFKFDDYKGLHIKKKIKNNPLIDPAGYILFLIPKGSKAAYINDITILYRHAKELLIDKGQLYSLVGSCIILNKDTYIIKLMS